MTPALGKEFAASRAKTVERLAYARPGHASRGFRFFPPEPSGDVAQRGVRSARTVAAAKAATGTLGDVACKVEPAYGLITRTKGLVRSG